MINPELVNDNLIKAKPWWNKKLLDPIVNNRNRARRWMLLTKTQESTDCYWYWQNYFKDTISNLKKNHWRKFLAESNHHQIFTAYKFIKPSLSNCVDPLIDNNGRFTSNKHEQAQLLFSGTSDVPINCDLSDISTLNFQDNYSFPEIHSEEIESIINHIKKKKAPGSDLLKNEHIIFAKNILIQPLKILMSACLHLGYFPSSWKHATTMII